MNERSQSMSSIRRTTSRTALQRELRQLSRRMVFGTLSETRRTCGQPTCRCQRGSPKNGPHLQISCRGDAGKTTGEHVPAAIAEQVRDGVPAWQRFQVVAREVTDLNREVAWAVHRKAAERR
jgi:hypothetical protein